MIVYLTELFQTMTKLCSHYFLYFDVSTLFLYFDVSTLFLYFDVSTLFLYFDACF